ncbi:hypothetical protein FHX74_000805 [Friedmanniella endophytica]|uniref:HlyD family secretion protein n=1 Tax=Microlunatus kandeliicorticis TaxID=1759536 RepID=A0A7W3IQ71_9ACTN|nr:HlyD family efflux transporter periplasmic adaptor subunit [Microlunatus kandeliicorticis]MBA8793211.1 hypothetical protein [Microlunatus kandeliicorticis]
MTWIGRLRLLGGILAVVALVSVLTLVFNHRQTEAASHTATISTEQYAVGAAYGGTVTQQYVKDGDTVTKGQKLFTVLSIQLRQDVENGLTATSSDAYTVDQQAGTVTYRAVSGGTITDFQAKIGSSVISGATAARIDVTGSQFVIANYVLTPRDYDRVEKGATADILLPNDQTVRGTITAVKVQTRSGQADTEVRIDSDALRTSELAALAQSGTPVTATLHLRPVGPLAEANQIVFDFLRKIGVQ